MNNQQFSPLHPKIVLAVGAHPDDMDFGAGGSLATFAAQGADIHYLQLTDGSSGSADTSITREQVRDTRKQEQQTACDLIGGTSITFLDHCDGCLENTQALKKDIVKVIRRLKPDTVITMDPSMIYSVAMGFVNHPDHRAAGQATLDAVYPLARDHLSFPELYEQGYQPHNVQNLLLLNFNDSNFHVDVSDAIDVRRQLAAEHVSQNGAAMAERVIGRAQEVGKQYGCDYAEAFVRIEIS